MIAHTDSCLTSRSPRPVTCLARLDVDVGPALLNHNTVQGPVRLFVKLTGVHRDLVEEHHVVHSHHLIPQRAIRVQLKYDILRVEFQGPTGTRPTLVDRPPSRHLVAAMFQPQVLYASTKLSNLYPFLV